MWCRRNVAHVTNLVQSDRAVAKCEQQLTSPQTNLNKMLSRLLQLKICHSSQPTTSAHSATSLDRITSCEQKIKKAGKALPSKWGRTGRGVPRQSRYVKSSQAAAQSGWIQEPMVQEYAMDDWVLYCKTVNNTKQHAALPDTSIKAPLKSIWPFWLKRYGLINASLARPP